MILSQDITGAEGPGRGIMTTIYILDIDGTLMPSDEIDNQCYWQAVEGVFQRSAGDPDLTNYRDVTDTGILEQWCRENLGRSPKVRETRAIRRRFLELLKTVHEAEPMAFTPRRGLLGWLQQACDGRATGVAIATGGWEHSARFKLEAADLERFRLPLAHSDDAITRVGIMQCALQRVASKLEPARLPILPHQVTYVGDGPWDFEASQALGWKFVGIATADKYRKLKDYGATRVYPDFLEWLRHSSGPEGSELE